MEPEYEIEWPDYFEVDESVIRSKGCFSGLVVNAGGYAYRLNLYDHARLHQEIVDSFDRGEPLFCEENLVVVPEVDRTHIAAAVEELHRMNFAGLIRQL